MKYLLMAFLLSVDLMAQSVITFYNRNLKTETGPIYHAPVSLPDGTRVRGDEFTAGLFLVQGDQLHLLATTHFRDDDAGAGFFVNPPDLVEVPQIPPGNSGTFLARVWQTTAGSYENAAAGGRYYGEFKTDSGSPFIHIARLTDRNPPGGLTPADLTGIQPLVLVPEPSVTALLSASIGLLFLRSARERSRNGVRGTPGT